MKTILVDAAGTYTVEDEDGKFSVDSRLHDLLETYENRKIIVTNADDSQLATFALVDLPFEVFSLKHNPDKPDPRYFGVLLKKHNLAASDVVYFEHAIEAVASAESLGIKSYHFDHELRDYEALKDFLDSST